MGVLKLGDLRFIKRWSAKKDMLGDAPVKHSTLVLQVKNDLGEFEDVEWVNDDASEKKCDGDIAAWKKP